MTTSDFSPSSAKKVEEPNVKDDTMMMMGKVEDPNDEDNTPKKEDENEDEEEDILELEEDVYSMLFLCNTWSIVGLYCIITIFIQWAIIVLFMKDIQKGKSDLNRFNFPVSIDKNVQIAQFLAVPLCIMSHDDFTTALYLLRFQWSKEILSNGLVPNATYTWWYISLILRIMIGFLLVFLSFIQIMLATTITDLFLNLEAIVFVGNIDNFAFWLAKHGFLKDTLKVATTHLDTVKLYPSSKLCCRSYLRKLVLLLFYFILIFSWYMIGSRQKDGTYLGDAACKSFTVTFGDDSLLLNYSQIVSNLYQNVDPENNETYSARLYFEGLYFDDPNAPPITMLFSHFSGTYRLGPDPDQPKEVRQDVPIPEIIDKQVVYYEVIPTYDTTVGDDSLGKFHYCKGDEDYPGAWIFTIDAMQDAFQRDLTNEDCPGWLLRSPPTSAIKLEDVPTEGWKVWTGDGVVEATGFQLECDECKRPVDCHYHGKCNKAGGSGTCTCDKKQLGNTCDIDPPCSTIDVIYLGTSSFDYDPYGEFHLVHRDFSFGEYTNRNELLLVYNRPVYMQTSNSFDLREAILNQDDVEILYYSGNRWVYSGWNATVFVDYFLPDNDIPPIHSFWDQITGYDYEYFSNPTDSGTPVGLEWNEILDSGSRGDYGFLGASIPVKLEVHCVDCDAALVNFCGKHGSCNDQTKKCECRDCYGGYYCEYDPESLYVNDLLDEFLENEEANGGVELFDDNYFAYFWGNSQCLSYISEKFGVDTNNNNNDNRTTTA